ncbi:Hypothetical protein NocV09_01700240 [Nannochloropsis oceanica]
MRSLWLALLGLVGRSHSCAATSTRVLLDAGANLGHAIPLRMAHYLGPWLAPEGDNHTEVATELMAMVTGKSGSRKRRKYVKKAEDVLLLSLGDSATYHALMEYVPEWRDAPEKNLADAESFGVFTLRCGDITVMAGNGFPIDKAWNASTKVDTGAAFAAYELLQSLGFAFWSPLEGPIAPATLQNLPEKDGHMSMRWEAPRWRSRTFHLHTQHPLELTDVLQGFDLPLSLDRGGVDTAARLRVEDAWAGLDRIERRWLATGFVEERGREGDEDECSAEASGETPAVAAKWACAAVIARGEHCELWEEMVPDVSRFFEWSVAHRLNRIEWILLGNRRWGDLVASPLRQARLRFLAGLGQGMGLMVGVDDPIAFQQQHSWVMTTTLAPEAWQVASVMERVDWLIGGANFDFLSTEAGFSEFSAPDDKLMLRLLNVFASHVNGTWGKEATVKVHCSSNQFCKHFQDPRTDTPLNFNFLPSYAGPEMGVLPHTVQAYALDDPSAGVYGNNNFSFMADYIRWEGGQGGARGGEEGFRRQVHFYPETAYFINVDIDVPLFLPVYAERRLHDLLLLAGMEEKEGFRLAGTWNFDSGWEWGYWLNDIIMAASMWNPTQFQEVEGEKDYCSGGKSNSCGRNVTLKAFQRAVEQALRQLPPTVRAQMAEWVADLVHFQYHTLLLGELGDEASVPSPNQIKLSGIAYLCGKDTWVELPRRLGLTFTQPDYVGFDEHNHPDYPHVQPLLAYMRARTATLHAKGAALVAALAESLDKLSPHLLEHLQEMRDGIHLQALRAHHIALLYEATSPASMAIDSSQERKEQRQLLLAEGRAVLEKATDVVRDREKQYHAPMGRIAGWRENPTVYHWDYLWSVKSLYFWWRDQGRAEGVSLASRWSFCYLNRMDPSEVAVGMGKNFLRAIGTYLPHVLPWSETVTDCLAPPSEEFVFPRDL